MILDVQLGFQKSCEYFKLRRVRKLQKLQMRLNVGPSHATSRIVEAHMVFPLSI
jgi:hypothetical protein